MKLCAMDIETYTNYWCVCFVKDNGTRKICETVEDLKTTLNHLRKEDYIILTYNGDNFDMPILYQIMIGLYNPLLPADIDIFKYAEKKTPAYWNYLRRPFKFLDIMTMVKKNDSKFFGLKTIAGYIDGNTYEAPYDFEKPLPQESVDDVIKYCLQDCEYTLKAAEMVRGQIETYNTIYNMFEEDMSYYGQKPQRIVDKLLFAEEGEADYTHLSRIPHSKWLDIDESIETFEIAKYPNVLGSDEITTAKGGGIHFALKNYSSRSGNIYKVDATNMYMTILQNCIKGKHLDISALKELVDKRTELKAMGDPKAAAYKELIVTVTGLLGAKFSKLEDITLRETMTAVGQRSLLYLTSRLHDMGIFIIQLNTDGVIVEGDISLIEAAVAEVSPHVLMDFTIDRCDAIIQNSVNHYTTLYKGVYEHHGLTKHSYKTLIGSAYNTITNHLLELFVDRNIHKFDKRMRMITAKELFYPHKYNTSCKAWLIDGEEITQKNMMVIPTPHKNENKWIMKNGKERKITSKHENLLVFRKYENNIIDERQTREAIVCYIQTILEFFGGEFENEIREMLKGGQWDNG